MTERTDRCPVCYALAWELDYAFNGEDEVPVETCDICGWPPPSPHSVLEWREKWLTLGATHRSHPGPKHMHHIGTLLALLDEQNTGTSEDA